MRSSRQDASASHNWAVALPFAVLAVVFFFLGRRPTPDEHDEGNSDGTS